MPPYGASSIFLNNNSFNSEFLVRHNRRRLQPHGLREHPLRIGVRRPIDNPLLVRRNEHHDDGMEYNIPKLDHVRAINMGEFNLARTESTEINATLQPIPRFVCMVSIDQRVHLLDEFD